MLKTIGITIIVGLAAYSHDAQGCSLFHEMTTLPAAERHAISATVIGNVQTTTELPEGVPSLNGLRLRLIRDGIIATELDWYPMETLPDCHYRAIESDRLEQRFPIGSLVTAVWQANTATDVLPVRVLQYAGAFAALARVPDGVQPDPIDAFDFYAFRRRAAGRPASAPDATDWFHFEEYQFFRATSGLLRLAVDARMAALSRLGGYAGFQFGSPDTGARQYGRLLDWAQVPEPQRGQLMSEFTTRRAR